MERRSLQYTNAKSDKFWMITLEGVSHTVQYGRVGTAGQVQTKEFGSEAEAQKSFQKLLQEKLKKGYVEISVDVDPVELSQTKTLNHDATPEIDNTVRSNEEIWSNLQLQLEQDKKKLCELAALNIIPTDFWNNLNLDVRTSIAKQTFNVPEVYGQLAKDAHDQVRSTVAGNLYTPSDILLQLAKDSVLNVRLAVAKNNSAPEDALNLLSDDPYGKVKTEVDKTRDQVKKALQQIRYKLGYKIPQIDCLKEIHSDLLIDDGNGWDFDVRWYVKKTNSWDWCASSLEKEAQSLDKELRAAIALNPKTPIHVLRQLASDLADSGTCGPHGGTGYITRNYVKEAVALNESTPADVLTNLAEQNNLFIYLALAFNPQTPSEVLGKIATTENPYFPAKLDTYGLYRNQVEENHKQYLELLYLALAHHPKIPLEALERIAVGKIPPAHSRYTPISFLKHNEVVIRNDFSPQEAAKHTYRRRYRALAQNPQTTLEDLQKMLKNRDSGVRSAVGLNPLGLPVLLADCLKTPNTWSRLIALCHPALSPQLLVKFSTAEAWHDRYAITQNPNAPTEILQQLAQDTEPVVRNAAKVALGLDRSVAQPVIQAEDAPAPEPPEPDQVAPKVPEPTTVTEKLEIVRSLNLSPTDWLWATWMPLNPSPRFPAKPFNLEDGLKRLQQIPCISPSYFGLNWAKSKLSIDMTPEEAHFWLAAIICDMPGNNGPNARSEKMEQSDLVDYLRSLDLSQTPDLHRICVILIRDYRRIPPQIVLSLFNAFSFVEVCTTVFNFQQLGTDLAIQYLTRHLGESYIETYVAARHWITRKDSLGALVHVMQQDVRPLLGILVRGFKDYIWPHLNHQDAQIMSEQLRPVLKTLPSGSPLYFLAAYLGMEEIRTYLDTCTISAGNYLGTSDTIEIIFGAGDAQLVETYARTLRIGLSKPEYIRGWLANTQFNALDWICRTLIKSYSSQTTDLLQTFTKSVQAPEAAPYMLELWLKLKKSQLARQWLEDHPTHAVVGLIPVAAGENVSPIEAKPAELTKAAIAFLVSMKRKGYESLIRAALAEQPPEIATKINALVLDSEDSELPIFDEKTTPPWLKESIADLDRQKRNKPFAWVSAADLPSIAVGHHSLNEDQINACLTALNLSTLESPLPLVQHLKTHANPQSLDTFIWSLFERWLTEGGPAKEKWAMTALGLLGTDAIALKLTPLIRNWPGENQHPRAVLGLECLRIMGTDTALMQINGIAQKTKYQGLQARAEECMEAIARDRQLTQDQLEDRIIPDCGLDATGKRTFDFGARQFHFALGTDLKPLVKDDNGKHLATLPKPNAKDDAEKAQQAIADWKLLKKQVSEVVKIQSVRLEDAMICERRWPWAEFSTLLANHPLATHLVQRLIWGLYSPEGTLTQTFRMSEDQTYADSNDDALVPDQSLLVGIVHPIDLSENLKAQWGQILSDYEIIPPFPQIDRDVYRLTPEEVDAEEIQRFQNIPIPGEVLAYSMEKRGWQRGGLHDHGDYRVHYKDFDQGKVMAVVGDYECQHVEKSSIWGADAMDGCLFLFGQNREPYEYPAPGSWAEKHTQGKRLRLGEVHPLVISEVLRDLTAIASAIQD